MSDVYFLTCASFIVFAKVSNRPVAETSHLDRSWNAERCSLSIQQKSSNLKSGSISRETSRCSLLCRSGKKKKRKKSELANSCWIYPPSMQTYMCLMVQYRDKRLLMQILLRGAEILACDLPFPNRWTLIQQQRACTGLDMLSGVVALFVMLR